jgi:hypothetical protein
MCGRRGYLAKLNFMDIKKILDRRQALNKKGTLTNREIKSLVKDWHDRRSEEELNHVSVKIEMKAMEKKLIKYNVEQLGNIPLEREDGTMRVLFSQIGGCASMETQKKNSQQLNISSTNMISIFVHSWNLTLTGPK